MLNIVDMHCDTIMKIYQSEENGTPEHLRKNSFQLDREKLTAGEYQLQNFALFLDKQEYKDPYNTCKEMVGCFNREMDQNRDWITPVKNFEDILAARADKKVAALLTMEEGAPICGEIEKLEEFYRLGVRMMTLTWNYPNEIGFPNAAFVDPSSEVLQPLQMQKGLTEQGIAIVKRMEELGMIIDVSHGSDQLVEDVLAHTQKPFVASHSNARAVCPHYRNLPDSLIRKIADRGGVIGINYFELFLRSPNSSVSLIEAFRAHVDHLRNVGGIDCVGLGSDFDGIPVSSDLLDAAAVGKLYHVLHQSGYTSSEVEKIFNGNVLRLYKACL